MNQQAIETEVKKILVDKLKVSKTDIRLECTLKDLDADSLDKVEIIIEIEKKFCMAIPDDLNMEEQTIGSLCKYIETKF